MSHHRATPEIHCGQPYGERLHENLIFRAVAGRQGQIVPKHFPVSAQTDAPLEKVKFLLISMDDGSRLIVLKSKYNRCASRLNAAIFSGKEHEAALIQLKVYEGTD